jgi:hypothetical protein
VDDDREFVIGQSHRRSLELAVRLWALSSAEYPKKHQPMLDQVADSIVDTVTQLAVVARRLLDQEPLADVQYHLATPRWSWAPSTNESVVLDLRDALNRIIHADRLQVGFESLPQELSVIDGGGVVVPYIKARTDRRPLSFIDPFAMAHAILYGPIAMQH